MRIITQKKQELCRIWKTYASSLGHLCKSGPKGLPCPWANEALKKTGFTRKTPTSSPEQKRRSSARRAALGEQKVRSQIWNEIFWIWSESLSLFCVKAAPPRGLGLTHSCPFRTHSKRALSRTKSPKNPFFRKKPSRAPKSTKLVPFRPSFQNRSAPNVSSASHFHASSFTPIHFELKFSEFVRFFFF